MLKSTYDHVCFTCCSFLQAYVLYIAVTVRLHAFCEVYLNNSVFPPRFKQHSLFDGFSQKNFCRTCPIFSAQCMLVHKQDVNMFLPLIVWRHCDVNQNKTCSTAGDAKTRSEAPMFKRGCSLQNGIYRTFYSDHWNNANDAKNKLQENENAEALNSRHHSFFSADV